MAGRGSKEDVFETGVAFGSEPSANFVELAVRDFCAVFENQDVSANLFEQAKKMGADDDGRAITPELTNGFLHRADAARIEAREWLIEEDNFGLVQEAAGQGKLLFHASRKFARHEFSFIGNFELLENLFGARFVIGKLIQPGREGEMLSERKIIEQARLVGEEGQLPLGFDWFSGEVDPVKENATLRRRNYAGEATKRGGLAGSVGADQPHDVARLD